MDPLSRADETGTRIVARARPERVILFGSYARGEAGEESDVDLLVLFGSIKDRHAASSALYEVLQGLLLPKDIVVATVADYERYKGVANTIYQAAAQHGVVLYDDPA